MASYVLIEGASLRAWPAAEEVYLAPWLVRFADGYTKRANSATYLVDQPQGGIEKCEAFYAERRAPTVFRIQSFAPPAIDEALASRGYHLLEPTQVMELELKESRGPPGAIDTLLVSDWIQAYHMLRGGERPLHPQHERILSRIDAPILAAVLRRDGQVVSCGLGVQDGEYLGVFDMVTALEHRRRGYARELLSYILGWGKRQGARTAYLQVLDANIPASQLYSRLGFRACYSYWYRANRA
jgi:GNAT superfamily N-acetyltransferase